MDEDLTDIAFELLGSYLEEPNCVNIVTDILNTEHDIEHDIAFEVTCSAFERWTEVYFE